MSKSTISTFRLFELFPDQETARVYLESRLWPNGPVCPQCANADRITTRKGGYYRCNACGDFDFTVRTGTVMERSKIPLHKWLTAMLLLDTTAQRIAEETGLSLRSAWMLRTRVREALGQ